MGDGLQKEEGWASQHNFFVRGKSACGCQSRESLQKSGCGLRWLRLGSLPKAKRTPNDGGGDTNRAQCRANTSHLHCQTHSTVPTSRKEPGNPDTSRGGIAQPYLGLGLIVACPSVCRLGFAPPAVMVFLFGQKQHTHIIDGLQQICTSTSHPTTTPPHRGLHKHHHTHSVSYTTIRREIKPWESPHREGVPTKYGFGSFSVAVVPPRRRLFSVRQQVRVVPPTTVVSVMVGPPATTIDLYRTPITNTHVACLAQRLPVTYHPLENLLEKRRNEFLVHHGLPKRYTNPIEK